MSKQTIADKQFLAKVLYTSQQLDQNVIAKKLNVSAVTICNWVKKFGWKDLRNRLLVGKEELLNSFYEQLAELNETIRMRDPGFRYSNSKEGDVQVKLTASIRNLETDLAIADIVESGIRFIKHLQKVGNHDQVILFTDLWHSFIQANLKK